VLDIVGSIVLGILFGFALQRGSFCGASLLSSVVLYRDWKGLVAILAAVLVSMVGFAFLAHMGWIITNPNPLRLLSAVVGGTVFGVGMVLAGGCVTGTLYKAGEGRLTSMLALATMGAGALAVDGGLLKPVKRALVKATMDIEWSASLDEALQMDYGPVAGVIGGVGLVVLLAVLIARRRKDGKKRELGLRSLVRGGWSTMTAGIVIGVLGWAAYPMSGAAGRNMALGGMGGVKGAFSYLVTGDYGGTTWMIGLVGGILVGSALSTYLRGDLRLKSGDASTLLVALLGGLLLGAGASIGHGCFIGNGVSGLALLSLHSLVFVIFMIAANWVTTALYLRGIR